MDVIIQRGQIWNAIVPFNESQAGKKRPAVILGWSSFEHNADHNVLLVPVTTFNNNSRKATSSDIALTNYAACGLSENSFIRCARLMTLHPNSIDFASGPLGTLVAEDYDAVLTETNRLFSSAPMQVLKIS